MAHRRGIPLKIKSEARVSQRVRSITIIIIILTKKKRRAAQEDMRVKITKMKLVKVMRSLTA